MKNEDTTTGSIPNPAQTAQGPSIKVTDVTDRRHSRKKLPVLLKRFRKYVEEKQ